MRISEVPEEVGNRLKVCQRLSDSLSGHCSRPRTEQRLRLAGERHGRALEPTIADCKETNTFQVS